MLADIDKKRDALAAICRRYGVARLEVFGSAARGAGFDPNRSDADFLVTFSSQVRNDLAAFADLKEALEKLLGRPVDLVEREALEASRNFIRRRAILKEAETVWLSCQSEMRHCSSICCSRRVTHWIKVKNPEAPATTRVEESDWVSYPRSKSGGPSRRSNSRLLTE